MKERNHADIPSLVRRCIEFAATCEEYRPIPVTPMLFRVMEKLVVRNTIYPVLQKSDISSAFADQYAFRPTGSTTAALMSVLRDLSELSQDDPNVQIIVLDFSKAFENTRSDTTQCWRKLHPYPSLILYITG